MQFRQTLRGGVTPEGKQLNGQYMPWSELGAHSDDELSALYQYLHSLPALEDSPNIKRKLKAELKLFFILGKSNSKIT